MLRTQIRALLTRAGSVGAWVGVRGARLAGAAMRRAQSGLARGANAANTFAKRVGSALFSEQLREHLMATGAFAALALIAAASLDFLINGGPNWSPNAEAAPYVADGGFVTLNALPDVPYVPPAALPQQASEVSAPFVVYVVASEELLGGPLDDYQPVALVIGGSLAEASEGQNADIGFGAELMTMRVAPF